MSRLVQPDQASSYYGLDSSAWVSHAELTLLIFRGHDDNAGLIAYEGLGNPDRRQHVLARPSVHHQFCVEHLCSGMAALQHPAPGRLCRTMSISGAGLISKVCNKSQRAAALCNVQCITGSWGQKPHL